ncbi:MAG TPA: sugar transferase [Terracidiphilus sp.]
MHKTSLFSEASSAGIGTISGLEQPSLEFANHSLVDFEESRSFAPGVPRNRIKRIVDVCLSLLLLVLLMPLIALTAAVIWAEGDGPLLYISRRIGRYGRPFTFYKFRTMIVDAESLRNELDRRNERSTVLFKISNDPRITKMGRILRKYSIDEIPQLINVLRGEMSLVGPRPSLAAEVEQYEPQHFVRLTVLPGMTGLWQVVARKSPSFHDYINLDLSYVHNWSLWLDLKILLRTIGVVLAGTGE